MNRYPTIGRVGALAIALGVASRRSAESRPTNLSNVTIDSEGDST